MIRLNWERQLCLVHGQIVQCNWVARVRPLRITSHALSPVPKIWTFFHMPCEFFCVCVCVCGFFGKPNSLFLEILSITFYYLWCCLIWINVRWFSFFFYAPLYPLFTFHFHIIFCSVYAWLPFRGDSILWVKCVTTAFAPLSPWTSLTFLCFQFSIENRECKSKILFAWTAFSWTLRRIVCSRFARCCS